MKRIKLEETKGEPTEVDKPEPEVDFSPNEILEALERIEKLKQTKLHILNQCAFIDSLLNRINKSEYKSVKKEVGILKSIAEKL